jgi:hypothetical protein
LNVSYFHDLPLAGRQALSDLVKGGWSPEKMTPGPRLQFGAKREPVRQGEQ